MASLYERKDSKFLWVKWRDASGKLRQESTGCLKTSGADKRRARQIEAEHTLAELNSGQELRIKAGWAWVSEFLAVRYRGSPPTLGRYLTAWATLSLFIEERQIVAPANFLRQHCYDFITWRQKPDVGKGKYRAGHNTALLEIKTLRLIMHEAVERRMINGNPCVRLGLKRDRPKVKAELMDEDCRRIREGIAALPPGPVKEMLDLSFEISRHQGCRLMETQLNPMEDVQIRKEGNTIRFLQKGGREFVTLLHPALVPLFERLQAAGRTTTWTTPEGKNRVWASSRWWKFLDTLGLKAKGVCFHSTRVTVVTELARQNVHESKAQSYVGHASTTVHRIYQRLRPKDLRECVDAVGGKRPQS